MPAKVVSQATFDAIVREAINDFGLSEEEALEEAKEQLAKAGVVDFSNIITSVAKQSAADHPAVRLATALSNAEEPANKVAALRAVAVEVERNGATPEFIGVVGTHGAVECCVASLREALVLDGDSGAGPGEELLGAACRAVGALCLKNELNRMRFVKAAPDATGLLKEAVRRVELAFQSDAVEACDVTCHVLHAARAVQRRNESVKSMLASGTTLDQLLSMLDGACRLQGAARAHLLRAACIVLRQLIASDDDTTCVAETFNRARALAGESVATPSGLKPLQGDRTLPAVLVEVLRLQGDLPPATVVEALALARHCAASDDICKTMIQLGFGEEATRLLGSDELRVVRGAVALLRNLAAHDDCKSAFAALVPRIRQATLTRSDVSLAEHYCALVASLCLRRPDLARHFAADGSAAAAVQCMERHADEPAVLRSACHAIRNVASRDEEARAAVLAIEGVERRVRDAMRRYAAQCDAAAYDALRDLDVLKVSELRKDERYKLDEKLLAASQSNRR